eukprot:Blabericola_migrator_1__3797@NODE_2141_length_3217_cov_178_626032_g1355_i0_p3_GENE_NODE_2141_length_3217_cov_178_626032_g1355_i0NODE_2141_length_3217_cov_178_626032_g1355_i0_p3_ORF_typecomplete_len127_score4_69Prenyltrans/PF00432_21/0_32Prenyltrans/PF00432_21/3e03Prenyltrans/PF00432_21/2_4e03_NODE_2141_length_3217_cov_178_626032_g1355_i0322702
MYSSGVNILYRRERSAHALSAYMCVAGLSLLYGALCPVSLHGLTMSMAIRGRSMCEFVRLRFCGDASQRSHCAVVFHVFKDPDGRHEHQDAVPLCVATCFKNICMHVLRACASALLRLSCVYVSHA